MITTKQLQKAAPLLNLKAVARESGLKYNSLYTKLSRGTELKESEITSITKALKDAGISFEVI